jgi:hypothetical protein
LESAESGARADIFRYANFALDSRLRGNERSVLLRRRVGVRGGPGVDTRRLERGGHRFLDVIEPDELKLLARFLGDVVEVLAVARR